MILDVEMKIPAADGDPERDRDVLPRILLGVYRVLDDVQQRPLHEHAIDVEPGVPGQTVPQHQRGGPPGHVGELHELVDELGHRDHLHLLVREPRQRPEGLDELLQVGHLFADHLDGRVHQVGVLGIVTRRLLVDLLHRQQDRRQRVLDLVGQPPRHLLPGAHAFEIADALAVGRHLLDHAVEVGHQRGQLVGARLGLHAHVEAPFGHRARGRGQVADRAGHVLQEGVGRQVGRQHDHTQGDEEEAPVVFPDSLVDPQDLDALLVVGGQVLVVLHVIRRRGEQDPDVEVRRRMDMCQMTVLRGQQHRPAHLVHRDRAAAGPRVHP